MLLNLKRVVGEIMVGSWKSYQVGLGEGTFLQGKQNYTLLTFLKDGSLFSERQSGNERRLEHFESTWEIHEQEGRPYLVVDGVPLYEIVSLKKEVLKLKGFSGIDVFFISEKKWNSLDFPACQVHAQA